MFIPELYNIDSCQVEVWHNANWYFRKHKPKFSFNEIFKAFKKQTPETAKIGLIGNISYQQ